MRFAGHRCPASGIGLPATPTGLTTWSLTTRPGDRQAAPDSRLPVRGFRPQGITRQMVGMSRQYGQRRPGYGDRHPAGRRDGACGQRGGSRLPPRNGRLIRTYCRPAVSLPPASRRCASIPRSRTRTSRAGGAASPPLVAAVPALPAAAALVGRAAHLARPVEAHQDPARRPPPHRRSTATPRARRALRPNTPPARALAGKGIAATVLSPKGGDFNDDLAALGPQALAARLGHGTM